MTEVTILAANGVLLEESVVKAIQEDRVVWATASGTENTRILYAKSLDRRDRPEDLIIAGTPAELSTLLSGFEAMDVAVEGETTEVEYHLNPAFIEFVSPITFAWNGVLTVGAVVEYTEGAFLHRKWYVTDQSILSTTTTEEPATTTTEEPATTTTTEEVTTTTTT